MNLKEKNNSEVIGRLHDIGDFNENDVIFDESPTPFEFLGGIKPLEMKWLEGTGNFTITSNYIPVPTHQHEFCIEEYETSDYAKSERYFVKQHRDEYYFESFYNPRDKSNHERLGLCSQDLYDCVGFLGRLVFETHGRKYCVIGLSHSFPGLHSPFLLRLENLFPEDMKVVEEFWEDIEEEIRVWGDIINNHTEEEEGEEEEEDHQRFMGESELEKKKKRMVKTYKYFIVDSFSVFGFLLELRIIKKYFVDFLNNNRVNSGFGGNDLVVDKEFLENDLGVKNSKDTIEFGLVQGNKSTDNFHRCIGFKSIMNRLGELPGGENFIDHSYKIFERTYIRLDDTPCYPGPAIETEGSSDDRCGGKCHNCDVILDKDFATVVHYKCRGRKVEEERYRKDETLVYPFVLSTEQFLGDIVSTEIDLLWSEHLKEFQKVNEKLEETSRLLRSEYLEEVQKVKEEVVSMIFQERRRVIVKKRKEEGTRGVVVRLEILVIVLIVMVGVLVFLRIYDSGLLSF